MIDLNEMPGIGPGAGDDLSQLGNRLILAAVPFPGGGDDDQS